MKSNEIFSVTAIVSVLSFVAYWLVPLHFYLQIYSLVINLLVGSRFGSIILNFASKFIANYLMGILENRANFPVDAILAFR